MNSTKSFSNRNTIVSYFTGIGLFVTTVAIYQYIQIYHAEEEEESGSKKFNNNNNDDDVDAADKEEEQRKDALRKAFERRQLSRRLSFDQFEDTDTEEVLPIQEAEKHRFWNGQMDCDSTFRQRQRGSSRSNNNNNNAHSSNEHPYPPPRRHHHHRRHREQQQQRRRRHQPLETADNDRYHDFHPNYQNWCHFEKNNEDDNKAAKKKRRKQAQQQQQQRQPKIIQHNRHQQQGQDAGEKQQESPAAAEKDHQVYSLSEAAAAAAAANDVVNEKTTNCEESRQKSVTTRKVSLYDLEKSKQMRRRQRQQQQQVDYISDDNNSIVTFASSYDDDHCNDHCNNHDNDVDRITSTRTNIITSNNISLQICSNYQPNTTNKSSNHRQLIHRDITTSGNSRRRRGSNNSSISSKSCRNSNNSSTYRRTTDGTEGRFQRFCRMLSGDDDIGSSGSKEEDNISISGENHNTTIFSSLNSSSGISFSNNDADTEDDDDDDDDDAETLHRALRAEYNARIIPEKLVLIRHGQSAGNVNEALYATTPDNAMPITELGWNQAKKAGIILKEKIINSGETVHFIVSPYVRTVETFHGIVSAWCDPDGDEFASIADHNCKVNAWYERLTELGLTWNEDSRIREQDFGNYQTPELTKRAKEERHKFGAFYYRFNNGESGSDVFDRVSTFLDSLWRSFETNKSQNYVLVTHGIVLRVLMARYFRYTISQLNMLANPTNCEMVILGHNWRGRLVLEGRCELEMTTTNTNTDTEESNDNDENISERNQSDKQKKPTASYRVTGYAFHKRLRILPERLIPRVKFRISSHDETKF